jgi:hypothetical protein
VSKQLSHTSKCYLDYKTVDFNNIYRFLKLKAVMCLLGKMDRTFQIIVPCVGKCKVQLEHILLITCIFLTEIGQLRPLF